MDGLTGFLRRAILGEHHKAARGLVATLRRAEPDAHVCHYLPSGRLQIATINGTAADRWRPFVVLITDAVVRLYAVDDAPGPPFEFAPDALRWFGRPKKYHQGRNALWLHVQLDKQWTLVQLEQYYSDTLRLVRALKAIAPHLVTPYRRHRPYIHYGPVKAQRATQDVHGAWTLHEATDLYLMPLHLVLLDGDRVRGTIPVETVTQVRGVQRLDAPGGVVRFQSGDDTHAFAVADYRQLAEALAEAARRSLEQPLELLETKRKKKRVDA